MDSTISCDEMNPPRHPIQMETEPDQRPGEPVAAPPTAALPSSWKQFFGGGQKQVSRCQYSRQSLFFQYYFLLFIILFPRWTTLNVFLPTL